MQEPRILQVSLSGRRERISQIIDATDVLLHNSSFCEFFSIIWVSDLVLTCVLENYPYLVHMSYQAIDQKFPGCSGYISFSIL